jgi:hypothetical protein
MKVKLWGPNSRFGVCPQSAVNPAFFSIGFRRTFCPGTKKMGAFPHKQATDDDNDVLKFINFPQGQSDGIHYTAS